MGALWQIFTLGSFVTAAVAALLLAAWTLPRRDKLGPAGGALVGSLGITAALLLAVPALGARHPATEIMFCFTYIGWLWTVYRLFANDDRHQSVRPIRSVVLALVLVEFMQIALIVAGARFSQYPEAAEMIFRLVITFRLLFAVGALVLVHNLYAGATSVGRYSLHWPAAALAVMWLYDLNFHTVAYLSNSIPETLSDLRGLVMLCTIAFLGLWCARDSAELTFSPSRSVAFQSFSLLVIGGYLVAMVLLAQGLAYAGGDFARLAQVAFVVIASSVALFLLPSKRLRGWFRVTFTKHLFQHRYDYRAEWLRFTKTIGQAGQRDLPLEERIVQAVADITDSPRGLLLTPNDDAGLSLDARWQWPQIDVPANALPGVLMPFLQTDEYVIDLDDVRDGQDERIAQSALPQWLLAEKQAWALVPLVHYRKLIGVVVLARPPVGRKLDWEDFDLLRVVGQQLASYLAEQEGQEALIEAHRFDEFNRRMAFVMHDIKNLASQLSLLSRNAERHAENPEFRADMLVTLRNSADKLNILLARLGRYGASGADTVEPVDICQTIGELVARFEGQHQVVMAEASPCVAIAAREPLEQALVHLVQNAIDASEDKSPVYLNVLRKGVQGQIEVVDSGTGMSADFVRRHLFKPFHSSKAGGFGIGAFEARELIRAMNGTLDVESREGMGTRFLISLPLSDAAYAGLHQAAPDGDPDINPQTHEVA